MSINGSVTSDYAHSANWRPELLPANFSSVKMLKKPALDEKILGINDKEIDVGLSFELNFNSTRISDETVVQHAQSRELTQRIKVEHFS
jgi:hypothetical protein